MANYLAGAAPTSDDNAEYYQRLGIQLPSQKPYGYATPKPLVAPVLAPPTASRYATPGGVDPELDQEIARTRASTKLPASEVTKRVGILQNERTSQIATTADRQKSIDLGLHPDTGLPLQTQPPSVGSAQPMPRLASPQLPSFSPEDIPSGNNNSPIDPMDRRYPVGYQMPVSMAKYQYPAGSPEALVMGDRPQPAYKPNTPVDMSVADASIKKYRANNPVGPPDTTNWPQFTGALRDSDTRISEAVGRGDYGAATARGIAGALGAVPAAAVDYWNQWKSGITPAAEGGRNFLSELTSGWIPRADAAAKAAAAKEVGSYTPLPGHEFGMGNRSGDTLDYQPLNAPPTAPPAPGGGNKGDAESADSNARWNAFVQSQLGSLNAAPAETGMGPGAMPTWTKQAGEAAINAGGAPRNLTYGYGTAIVGSGATTGDGVSGDGRPGPKGRFNTYTGVGQGPAPMGGAGYYGPSGGPGGARGGGSIDDIVDSHMRDVIAQHDQYSNDGTMTGMRKAHELRGYLARLEGLRQGEGTRQYQQGAIGVEQQKARLEWEKSLPGIAVQKAKQKLVDEGHWDEAMELERTMRGETPQPAVPSTQPFTFVPDKTVPGGLRWVGGYPVQGK